uniref:Cysteine protease n=1 Tax=Trichuris muris TaxID=70415 RepID=A0A5S6Q2J3_TRIMR
MRTSVLVAVVDVDDMLDPWCINFEHGFLEAEDREMLLRHDCVWILGRCFKSNDFERISKDLYSKTWFTYRKNFTPIGGTGPTTDQGWGCMLRCGQMLLAQAMINRHLGRDWCLDVFHKEPKYYKILSMFQDNKNACYSIHQIAKMGETEGKAIGEWFGPSTIAHVMKKLAVHDEWSSLAVHVAMDNIIFLDDVMRTCLSFASRQDGTADGHLNPNNKMGNNELPENGSSSVHDSVPVVEWRPLLLLIPLRLGLTQLNSCYIPALLELFTSPNSLGMLGGRPNHALYFIGHFGENLLYLDPHQCQSVADLNVDRDLLDDSSYHTLAILHMPIEDIDPSVALAFFFATENEFNNFCDTVRTLHAKMPCTMFEIMPSRPDNWPPFVPYGEDSSAKTSDFLVLDNTAESDDDFEVLN